MGEFVDMLSAAGVLYSLGGVVEFLSALLYVAEEGEDVVDLSSLVSVVEKFV